MLAKNSIRTWLIVIALVIVLSFLGLYLKGASSPSEYRTENVDGSWQTYVSDVYGFQIRYPDDWTLRTLPEAPEIVEIYGQDFESYLIVRVKKGESVEKSITTTKNSVTGSCSGVSDASISEIPAKKITCKIGYFDTEGSSEATFLYVGKGDDTYVIGSDTGREISKKGIFNDQINKMIGTFKFN